MKRLTVLAIVLLSATAACSLAGKDGAPGPAGPAGPGATRAGGDKPTDKPADEPSDGTPSGPAAATKTGTVTLTQMSFTIGDQEINSFSAMAVFTDATGVAAGAGGAKCTTSKEGSCDVMVCDVPADSGGGSNTTPPPAGEPKKAPNASDITITGAEEIVLEVDGDTGNYTPASGQTKVLAAGEDVKVKAKGKEVPAFDKTVKAPSLVTVTAPEWPGLGEAFAVDRTADLELAWDNGTEGDVTASISSITDKKIATVSCKFKADANAGKITKAALGKLVASEQGSISISGTSSTAFDQGGWKITLTATSPGSVAAGGVASATANIQ